MVDFSNIPVAQALTGLLNNSTPSHGGIGTVERDRWMFTSTLRLLTAQLRGQSVELNTDQDVSLTTNFSLAGSMTPYITMAINPKSVTFTQPKRISERAVRNGTVFFHFTNSKGQNNDILKLRFQGSTGNIDPRGDLADPSGAATGALHKLKVWHNLYQLTREPILLGDNSVNVFSIIYNSKLIPVPIEFRGFYGAVLDFSETAEKPNSREYSFEFTVTNTEPDLDDLVGIIASATVPTSLETSGQAGVGESITSSLFGDGTSSLGG